MPKKRKTVQRTGKRAEPASKRAPLAVQSREAKLPFAPILPDDVFGSLRYSGPPKTLEEMNEGIAREAKRRHARLARALAPAEKLAEGRDVAADEAAVFGFSPRRS